MSCICKKGKKRKDKAPTVTFEFRRLGALQQAGGVDATGVLVSVQHFLQQGQVQGLLGAEESQHHVGHVPDVRLWRDRGRGREGRGRERKGGREGEMEGE
jgi:hypothetical protein